MKHSFIDKYSDRASVIHRLDPRTKIVAALLFVLAVVLTPPRAAASFLGYGFLLFAVLAASGIPPRYALLRSLTVAPFVLFIVLAAPPAVHPWSAGMKAWLSALAMILLSSTTRFDALLKGFEALKVPRVFILLLSFMYRYVFVLVDEAMRMQRARDARACGGSVQGHLRAFAGIIGSLFIRTYERGERVYAGMLCRGFDGEIRTLAALRFAAADMVFLGGALAGLAAIRWWLS